MRWHIQGGFTLPILPLAQAAASGQNGSIRIPLGAGRTDASAASVSSLLALLDSPTRCRLPAASSARFSMLSARRHWASVVSGDRPSLCLRLAARCSLVHLKAQPTAPTRR